jgi:hypothetical protein
LYASKELDAFGILHVLLVCTCYASAIIASSLAAFVL